MHLGIFSRTSTFYEIVTTKKIEPLTIGHVYSQAWDLDEFQMVHTREVYGLLDFIGDCGGLYDGLGYLVVALIQAIGLLGENRMLVKMI